MPVTLKEIAARAGFSTTTVHQILKGSEAYAEKTRERVQAVVAELGYESNIAARSMREGRTYLLGVLYSGVNKPYIAEVMEGMQDVAWGRSYVPIFMTHNSCQREKKNCEALLRRRVDGLVVNAWVEDDGSVNTELFKELRSRKVPMIEIFGRNVRGVPSINVDNRTAGRMAVQRLVARGHRRIAHFTHARYNLSQKIPGLFFNAWEFHKGYEEEMRASHLEPVTVTHEISKDLLHPGYAYGQAFEAAPRLLNDPSAPTAVVCIVEEEAEGLMHYVVRHPEAAPRGFEAVALGGAMATGVSLFTTHLLQLPMREIGAAAASGLLSLLNGKRAKDVLVVPTWGGKSDVGDDMAEGKVVSPSNSRSVVV